LNSAGLQLIFFETHDGLETDYVVPQAFAGAPGVAHCGIQAAILDETLCVTALTKAHVRVVTGQMTIRYLRPVPTATVILARGHIVARQGRSLLIEGAICLANTREELTRAHGRFFPQGR
jgi:acyl-coenzyme A thioesterase PaaI-like protein